MFRVPNCMLDYVFNCLTTTRLLFNWNTIGNYAKRLHITNQLLQNCEVLLLNNAETLDINIKYCTCNEDE